jgi:hypothetical protein
VALCALIEMLMQQNHIQLLEPDLKALHEVLGQGKKKLGKSAFEAACTEGRSLSVEGQIMKLMVL